MHSNKLVVAIKTAGKVLREQGDKVYLPFGSEYSIFLKNLNSVRALVRVSLDGESVTDGEDLVIYGNSELNLERFLKKGNMNAGNRFKFIERSAKVEAHRGIEAEDGLLRVEFQFEKVPPKQVVVETIHKHYDHYYKSYPWYDPYPWNKPYYNTTFTCSGAGDNGALYGAVNNVSLGAASGGSIGSGMGSVTANACSVAGTQSLTSSSVPMSSPSGATRSRKLTKSAAPVAEAQVFLNQINDAGITVPGSVSEQKFQAASWFPVDDEKFVIVMKLLGEVGGHVVAQAITTKTKQTCPTCGTRNRGKLAAFCRECGTALEIVGQSPGRVAIR